MADLKELKKQIGYFKYDAEEEREGGEVDLANILMRVIHNYERRGAAYIVKRHWIRPKRSRAQRLKAAAKKGKKAVKKARKFAEEHQVRSPEELIFGERR